MASIFSVFKRGLEKSATRISRGLGAVFAGRKSLGKEDFELLEMNLIAADFGVKAAAETAAHIRDEYELGHIRTDADLSAETRNFLTRKLQECRRPMRANADGLTVLLFVGVNGSGKTTTIGKLACRLTAQGKKVVLGACDTFRAAAPEQLKLWGERSGAQVVGSKLGADPSGVAFDAVSAALSRNADYLLLDCAGRQQTDRALMAELAKLHRSVAKALPGAPHEVILTVDASLGSNAISQARSFGEAAGVTGLALTKLDGSGKGGMAAALSREFGLPTFLVGLGEGNDDLMDFDPELYTAALFGQAEENP